MIVHQPTSATRRFGLPAFSADRLAATLARHLDDGYHYLSHVSAGGGPPIDAVVVGAGGTWTLTSPVLRGRFRKRNGHWYEWKRSTESWIPWEAEAISAARLAGHRLELLLERAGLPSTVEATLVVPRAATVDWERDQRPGIHVCDDLEELARRIARDDVLAQAQVDRIIAVLDPRQPLPRLAPSPGG
jgi:hypothetical protein